MADSKSVREQLAERMATAQPPSGDEPDEQIMPVLPPEPEPPVQQPPGDSPNIEPSEEEGMKDEELIEAIANKVVAKIGSSKLSDDDVRRLAAEFVIQLRGEIRDAMKDVGAKLAATAGASASVSSMAEVKAKAVIKELNSAGLIPLGQNARVASLTVKLRELYEDIGEKTPQGDFEAAVNAALTECDLVDMFSDTDLTKAVADVYGTNVKLGNKDKSKGKRKSDRTAKPFGQIFKNIGKGQG